MHRVLITTFRFSLLHFFAWSHRLVRFCLFLSVLDKLVSSVISLFNFFMQGVAIKRLRASRQCQGECVSYYSVIVGFKNSSGDLISYLDADLQDPPELLNEMIKLYESNNSEDTIIHSIRKKREGENILKLFSTRLAYKIINLLSVINLPTECGDYKLFTRNALKKCLEGFFQ